MRAPATCFVCFEESGKPDIDSFAFEPIPNDGIIKFTCNSGHLNCLVVQQDRYELLFELAVQAIVDEYYREAIASFAASLERLYEFYLRVFWRSKGHSQDATDRLWKSIANSSERQFGSFIGCYFSEFGEAPAILDSEQVKLRNAVIHKCNFPTQHEAIIFGQAALNVARPLLSKLSEPRLDLAVNGVIFDNLARASEVARLTGGRLATMSISSPLSIAKASEATTMAEIVEAYGKRPDVQRILNELAP